MIVGTEAMAGIRGRLAHLLKDAQDILGNALLQKYVVASSLEDLRPAEVPHEHYFELDYSNPIYHSARRISPLHNEFARKELDKMLDTGIITPSRSA